MVTYDDEIIPLDAYANALAGQLEARAISAGHDPGMADATIAGIAKAHDLLIVTHNTKHFLPLGVDVATPDEAVHSVAENAKSAWRPVRPACFGEHFIGSQL